MGLVINNIKICSRALKVIYGLTNHTFKQMSNHAREGTIPVHGNLASKRRSNGTIEASRWLLSFVNDVGEQQPDSGFIHLPSYLDKTKLYNEMLDELTQENPEYELSLSQFFYIWSSEFKNVKIPVMTRLGRCNECSEFLTRRTQIKSEEEMRKWKAEKMAHLSAVAVERQYLTQRKAVTS